MTFQGQTLQLIYLNRMWVNYPSDTNSYYCYRKADPKHVLGRSLWSDIYNGTAHFKKCKQLFKYQHLLLLRDIWWSNSNIYLNFVHFFNTSVN